MKINLTDVDLRSAEAGIWKFTPNLTSLQVAGEYYRQVKGFEELRNTNNSYFFDGRTMFVHFDDWLPPATFSPIIASI